ncbi:hypothetical protein SAMN03159496_06519 [Rhizobium sp. NFR07]|jgi:ethanolamine utilization cobalamin adenosyltransferase|uniref:DUF6894 family protein n=1 Tax=Rhizobium sp. NFR07 TaxID=1566262 RepID=UPI0008E791A7|nr:hypothetical protein [Rhizobium sp. NFR07]SFB64640.1 hypothetical protein SAMN03159496_06519 [Rhizobium sp. NFR07]
MSRYFFHIRDGANLTKDTEGAEFENIDLAKDEALRSARELLAQRLLNNEVIDGQSFEITDDNGVIVERVLFKDAMRLSSL